MRNAWAFDETPLDSLVCSGKPTDRKGPSTESCIKPDFLSLAKKLFDISKCEGLTTTFELAGNDLPYEK